MKKNIITTWKRSIYESPHPFIHPFPSIKINPYHKFMLARHINFYSGVILKIMNQEGLLAKTNLNRRI